MITIKDTVSALRELASPHLPAGTKFSLQNVPKEPTPGTVAIRVATLDSTITTGALQRTARTYELIYFGKSNIDTIDAVDTLRRVMTEQSKFKAGASYLTVGAFSMSPPFKTENDVDAVICIVELSNHEDRFIQTYPKVNRVVLDFTIDDLQEYNTFNDVTLTGSSFDELAASATMDNLPDAEIGRSKHTQDITKSEE